MTRLLAAILALLPTLATAQTSCGARETVIEQLQTKYKEVLNAAGLQTANSLIEIWASAETGSWTILSTNQSGLSCPGQKTKQDDAGFHRAFS